MLELLDWVPGHSCLLIDHFSIRSSEPYSKVGVLFKSIFWIWLEISFHKDWRLDISRRLILTQALVVGLIIVPNFNIVLSEIIFVNCCIDCDWRPQNIISISIIHHCLGVGSSKQGVLIKVVSIFLTRSPATENSICGVIELWLSVIRIDESEPLDPDLCGSINWNKSRLCIEDIRIVVAVSELVVGVVLSVQRKLHSQDIRLSVLRNFTPHIAFIQPFALQVDSLVGRLSKSYSKIGAIGVGALEISAFNVHVSLVLGFDFSEGGMQLVDMRGRVERKTEWLSCLISIGPVLAIQGHLH